MLPDASAAHYIVPLHTHPFPALLIGLAYSLADMEGAFEFFPICERKCIENILQLLNFKQCTKTRVVFSIKFLIKLNDNVVNNCYLLKNRAIAPAHTNNTSTTMPTSIPRI